MSFGHNGHSFSHTVADNAIGYLEALISHLNMSIKVCANEYYFHVLLP